jgi:predicted Zn-dependent protease
MRLRCCSRASPAARTANIRLRSPAARCAAALCAALLGGCVSLTPQEEAGLGAQMHAQLQYEAQLLEDPVVASYVEQIGRRIVAASGPDAGRYRFYVVHDDRINAFASPGGYVYVNTGTIRRVRNVSELAGVIAHEVGHVARHHVAENVGRQRTARTVRQIGVVAAGVAAGPAAAGAANLLGGLASLAALNSFGREAERESDAFAVEVLPRAGYDPEGLVSFFQTLLWETRGEEAGSFLSDHPATEERIEETRRAIEEAELGGDLKRDDGGRLEIIQRRVELLSGAAPGVP